ncbi:MAG: hypothetical protein NTX17_04330 [Candidatus Eisenbacteria bacterium]|nr:hypothetical protein [Candidatus Eisenbacteria bacterium]
MDDERWEELVNRIELKLKVSEKKSVTGSDGKTKIETVIFSGPEGKMKLERTSKPLVLDKKTHYSKRIGSAHSTEYVYSPTEKVQRVQLFKWSETEQDWEEIRLDRLIPR